MAKPAPIVRKKVYELVAEHLLDEIRSRRLVPGTALPTERELTETLRVGRSSVREALRMLESRGQIVPGSSGLFTVAEPRNQLDESIDLLLRLDEANLGELYELRRVLEGEFAALAAHRRARQQLEEMVSATEAMQASLDDEEAYIKADLRFHTCIAEATRNRFALYLMAAIRDVSHRALRAIFESTIDSPARSVGQHRLIYKAIEAGDADEARLQMCEHLNRVLDDTNAAARDLARRTKQTEHLRLNEPRSTAS